MQRMSQGVQLITGTFTPEETPNSKIQIGKTLTKYMYLIEMTDASKTTLMASGYTSNRCYAMIGMYPSPAVGQNTQNAIFASYRIKPSTSEMSNAVANAGAGISGSQISIGCQAPASAGANYLMTGYTYNYTIIPLD